MLPGLCRRRSALAFFALGLANILPVARAIVDYPLQSFFFEWAVDEQIFPGFPFPVPVTGIYLPRLSAHVGTDLVQHNATLSISHGRGVQQQGKLRVTFLCSDALMISHEVQTPSLLTILKSIPRQSNLFSSFFTVIHPPPDYSSYLSSYPPGRVSLMWVSFFLFVSLLD